MLQEFLYHRKNLLKNVERSTQPLRIRWRSRAKFSRWKKNKRFFVSHEDILRHFVRRGYYLTVSDEETTQPSDTELLHVALEESTRQTVKLVFLLAGMAGVVLLQKLLEDPDVGYRIRWHLRHLGHVIDRRLHDIDIAVETAVGLYKIQEHLRHQWKASKP